MARKPTGRPRGRPRGSRQYPADDLLRIEMARLILNERAKNAADAARQVAPRADGPNTRDSSKARRLLNGYKSREQWFITQAQARPAPSVAAAWRPSSNESLSRLSSSMNCRCAWLTRWRAVLVQS